MRRIDWSKIFQSFSNKERITFVSLVLVAIVSLAATVLVLYFHLTKAIPVVGGEYTEGVVGQPLYINPVLAASNDADSDLCQLIYSGLFKYDASGKIVPDLAESYEISDDKLTYTVHLKPEVHWHDGDKFTSDDVLFTIQRTQDPAYKSPLRQNWQGVGVEVVDDNMIRFILRSPYTFFLNNLTIGILPAHIWGEVAPNNFFLTEYNLRPIGTGPFKFSDFQKDSDGNILSYSLVADLDYFGEKSFIQNLNFSYYFDEDSMIEAYNNKQIFGMSYVSPSKLVDIKSKRSSQIHSINIPRYFAIFFNQQKSKILADREVRKALSLAVDRKSIIDEVLAGQGKDLFSPIPPGTFGFTDDVKKFGFDLEKANKTLDDDGWKRGDDGMRKKDGQALEITLETTDWPDLEQTAELLRKQWEAIGVKLNVETLGISDIQQNFIRPREYEALLFGQVLGIDPDPYAFWHSSQTRDPGSNLALYSNSDVDKLLEETRQATNEEDRISNFKKFQQTLTDEIPALFLYSPNYLYVTANKVQGVIIESMVTPDKRFSDVTKWFVKTKRIKK